MASLNEKVLIVGAGPSGLVALKEMLEAGLDAVAVDARSQIGGVFSPNSNVTCEDLYLTTSNMFMAFSDFPPRDKYMKYWTKAEYYDYLCEYARHFQLMPHIQLGTSIKHAKLKLNDSETKNEWEVSMVPNRDDIQHVKTENYSYLIVATGANHTPRTPTFDGFQGEILHSSQFHAAEQLRGKKVLVVGVGESATDVAVSSSKVADSVTVWGRRVPDLAPRFMKDVDAPEYDEYAKLRNQEKRLPGDFLEIVTTSRIVRNLPLVAWSTILHILVNYVKNKYGPQSPHQVLWDTNAASWSGDRISGDTAIIPTKNAIMAVAASKGQMDLCFAPEATFQNTTVTFHNPSYYKKDFTKEVSIGVDIDVIVACTGYDTIELSDWLETPQPIVPNPRLWFKHCFPTNQMGEHIAFLGYARPHSGGIPQCSEMLARYVAQLRIGALKLPANYTEIARMDGACEDECYHLAPRNLLVVDYHAFMMSVARLIECTPHMPRDPLQMVKHWTFPLWPCFFRMRGPGAKPEACEEVLSKFGPYDALAFGPLLLVEVLFTFIMPFVNILSYLFDAVLNAGKRTTLPRGYWLRMSKFHFMYGNLRVLDREDFKFMVGQLIAGIVLVKHLVVTAIWG